MRLLLVCLLCVACGDDGGPSIDASTRDGTGGGGIDAPPGTIIDGGAADAASSLGQLCATEAFDGGPGSCPGAICCTTLGTYICTEPDECPGGTGFVPCTQTSDCQGRICCQLPTMTFCTKASTCDDYGGTVVD